MIGVGGLGAGVVRVKITNCGQFMLATLYLLPKVQWGGQNGFPSVANQSFHLGVDLIDTVRAPVRYFEVSTLLPQYLTFF